MLSICANPECGLPFDHGRGRFFRFHRAPLEGQAAVNTHSVQHFWLCKSCADLYTLELASGVGVVIKQRHHVPVRQSLRLIATA
jgi:hypothetical protein